MPRRRGLRPRLLAAVVRLKDALAFAAERQVVRRTSERNLMGPARLYNRSLQLLDGLGMQRDEGRAFELCAQAAAAGYHDAVLAIGWHYLNGIGVEADVDEAERWYKKSARQGEPRAMFSLGQIAYSGGDAAAALTWFERASELKHARSLYWIAKLYWRGHGVDRDQHKSLKFLQDAAARRDPEARRVLRFLSWRETRAGHGASPRPSNRALQRTALARRR